jgi:diaminopimelate decarboxylase
LPERKTVPEFDTAERLIEDAYISQYLELAGLHFHLGSQITNIDYFDRFFEVATRFFKIINKKYNDSLNILDIGGGYPVNYSSHKCLPSIEEISKSLSNSIKKADINPSIIIESGRFITATAGVLLSQISITKENSVGQKIAVLDLSVYSDLLDILTASWNYDCCLINNLPNSKQKESFNWQLVGGTNDALDQLTPSNGKCTSCKEEINKDPVFAFPRNLEIGDLIAVKSTGAYTTCFNSNYSGRPKPFIVLKDSRRSQKINRIR